MNATEIRHLDAGDEVFWEDPDNGESSGAYFITEVLTDNGQVTDFDDMLLIRNAEGSHAEVYVSELR